MRVQECNIVNIEGWECREETQVFDEEKRRRDERALDVSKMEKIVHL